MKMIEQLVNFVIRPPRADYSPSHDLLESEFLLKGRKYQRKDLEVTNKRGHVLQCSHYLPQNIPEGTKLPCVIYCHGNSGCRADANEAAIILLPSNVTVFTLDFSGSGLSDGDYVSLGWNEMEDLKAVVTFLRTENHVSRIGLWGRSMGAVTCLMYGAQDPSIAGMVLDSPFSNLFDLMMELVDVYKIRLPKFTVKVAVQYMRRVIQKKAAFDIMDLDTVQVSAKSFIPALFGHATEDLFIQPHHSDLLFKAYAGDKNIIKFKGDHNSPRPPFYYDSITIFFYNVLRPPDEPVAPEAPVTDDFDRDSFDLDDDVDESILYQIMGAERRAHETLQTPTSISSGHRQDGMTAESTEEALNQTRSRWQMSRTVVSAKSFIPALFGHATEDLFIQPHHSDLLFKAYAGDKNIIKFKGDHNSPRPPFYYDSITIFFYNVLRPPDEPVAPEAPVTDDFDRDGFDLDDDVDESILYQIMGAERRAHGTPQTPTSTSGMTAESTEEALNQTRSRWQMSRTVVPVNTSNSQDDLSELLRGDLSAEGLEGSSSCAILENGENGNYRDDFARYRSSKDYSDSWGRHSSNGLSRDSSGLMSPRTEDSFAHFPSNRDDEERMVMEAIAASLQDIEIKETEQKEPVEVGSPTSEDTAATSRVDSFTQRMRFSFFRGMGSRRSASR